MDITEYNTSLSIFGVIQYNTRTVKIYMKKTLPLTVLLQCQSQARKVEEGDANSHRMSLNAGHYYVQRNAETPLEMNPHSISKCRKDWRI